MENTVNLDIIDETFIGVLADWQGFDGFATRLHNRGYVVRSVRGHKCRTIDTMIDEFSAALQFPWYFGENWPAFDECICDLDWMSLSPERTDFGLGIVIAIPHSEQMLKDARSIRLPDLVDVLNGAAQEFGTTLDAGNWWDHGPITFKVILHGETPSDLDRWRGAGADIAMTPVDGA